jgi:uncharacterized membrane protein
MQKQILVAFFIFALIISTASAATIEGVVYDYTLDQLENVLITIDTVPEQQFLSTDGTFTFQAPNGEYTLIAIKADLNAEETIVIAADGKFIYDLFLFPEFSDEDSLIEDVDVIDFSEDTKTNFWPWVLLVIVLLALAISYVIKKIKTKPKQVQTKETKETQDSNDKKDVIEPKLEEPMYLDRAFEIIKKHDGRISQKDLRKEMMDLSEAKVSLILTELEHKGKIEKVKRGRGNVILLK